MAQFTAPARPLTDGVVRLRLPSPAAGDIDAVRGHINQDQLDGGWLPEIPLVSAEQAIGDWFDGWAGRCSRNGPIFVVTVPQQPRFIGIVGLKDRGEDVLEIDLRDRAALAWTRPGQPRCPAHCALGTEPAGVTAVELRIGQDHTASQHVANNAGFAVAGTVTQFVPGTGETFEDLRYVLEQQPAAGPDPHSPQCGFGLLRGRS